MFVGHFGLGFAGKRAAPAVSLGTLFLAVEFLDLLWPTFLLLGWERVRVAPGATVVTPFDFVSYPYSHSLLATLGWSLLVGGLAGLASRRGRVGLIVGTLVFSHWVLDFVTHRPDLPLAWWPSPKVGLELWASRPATLAVELALYALGVWIYARATVARDRAGRWGFVALVAFLFVAYLGAIFGPPPGNLTALAWGGQSMWLMVVWGYWLDRHRAPAAPVRIAVAAAS
jgi:hypothetical protein